MGATDNDLPGCRVCPHLRNRKSTCPAYQPLPLFALSIRRHNSDAQSQSLLHIVLSNPAADSDGLQILSGSPAADRAAGAITVTDGQAIATVSAAAVAAVADGEFCWDCKVTSAAGIDQVARGTLFVERDVTRLAAGELVSRLQRSTRAPVHSGSLLPSMVIIAISVASLFGPPCGPVPRIG